MRASGTKAFGASSRTLVAQFIVDETKREDQRSNKTVNEFALDRERALQLAKRAVMLAVIGRSAR